MYKYYKIQVSYLFNDKICAVYVESVTQWFCPSQCLQKRQTVLQVHIIEPLTTVLMYTIHEKRERINLLPHNNTFSAKHFTGYREKNTVCTNYRRTWYFAYNDWHCLIAYQNTFVNSLIVTCPNYTCLL